MSLTALTLLGLLAGLGPELPGAGAPPRFELTCDLPLGLLSRGSASHARAEISALGGVRLAGAWRPAPWTLAVELDVGATLPDTRGTAAVSFTEQQSLAALGGRAGYRLAQRGFMVEPFVLVRGAAGWRWTRIQIEGHEEGAAGPTAGLGYGAGAVLGHRALRLRLDVGGLLTDRAHYYTATLALGYAFP